MKKLFFVLMLMAMVAGGTVMASAQDGWRRDRDERRDVWRDRADRRADWRDMRSDRAAIAHDRWELRRDLRRGDYAAAAHERAELRGRYRDLGRDRWDIRRDNRDIRRDFDDRDRD